MTHSKVIWKNVFSLAIVGGVAFWLANFAISCTPIAAEYRAALSIPYIPMLLEALIGGLMIGFCASYFLLHFFEKIPTRHPLSKSVLLTFIVLFIVTAMISVPSISLESGDGMRYFLIGSTINLIRFLALGIGIGWLYNRLNGGVR